MTAAPFRLNPRTLANIVWRDLFSELDLEMNRVRETLATSWDACEKTRAGMAYNTGSITAASGLALYALARRYAPATTFEVGTFIGKSTVSIACGTESAGRKDSIIYTCDASNDFLLSHPGTTRIVGFPRKTSTMALNEVAAKGAQVDLFHIDGRLDPPDLALLQRLTKPTTIYALDDFEGMEKGVANLSMLRPQPWMGNHVLVYPPSQEILAGYGIYSASTTALLVPGNNFLFAPQ
jgi:predicted O-methyltransferase YrrM